MADIKTVLMTEGTLQEYNTAMRHFIRVVGDIDYHAIRHEHGEQFIQRCLDGGNRPATAKKKMANSTLKRDT